MSNQRVEFLGKIESRLSNLPNREVEKIISYYNESIEDKLDDGMTEEDAIKSFGTIDSIVSNIEEEISFNDVVKDKISNSNKTINVDGNTVHEITLDNKRVEYTFESDFAEIYFDTANRGLEIKKSADDNIHLIVYQNKYEYYEITENKNLIIKYVEDKNFFGRKISFLNNNKQQAELYIPNNEIQKLFANGTNEDLKISKVKLNSVNLSNVNGEIEASKIISNNTKFKNINGTIKISDMNSHNMKFGNMNGAIEASNIVTEDIFDVNNMNGSINLSNVQCEDIKVDNKNGNIDIKTVSCDSVKIDNKNGKININTVNSNNAIEISNKNGSIKANTIIGDDIKISNKSANIKITDISSKNNIDISNSDDNIDFSNVAFGKDFTVKCNNASVRGDVAGVESDYTFNVEARNGTVRVNGKRVKEVIGNGDKLIKIKSSNGSVNLVTK